MQIHRLPRPEAPDAAPHALTHAAVAVEEAALEAEYGHRDFADPARARNVHLFGTRHGHALLWVALPDGVAPDTCRPEDGIALASVHVPLQEDTEKAHVSIATHPDHRSRGHARAVLETIRPHLLALGRTTWLSWSFGPGAEATGPDAVVARTGSGALDGRLPAHRWLLAEGFTLEQCERPSTLRLDAVGHDLADPAAPGASDYDLVWWTDRTPAEHVDDIAWLCSRMSTDVPMGELGLDEQVWDAERVRTGEDRQAAAGLRSVVTAARHVPTGRLTAFTRLTWAEEKPAGVWQEETLVLTEHRGHGLGMRTKRANLDRLRRVNPDTRRVHTWNAVENRWMLAINDALGFVPVGLEGAWLKKF